MIFNEHMHVRNFHNSKIILKLELSITDTRWRNERKIQNVISYLTYIIQHILENIFTDVANEPEARISILLANNRTLKKLNNKFFQINQSTDILSFPFNNYTPGQSKKHMRYKKRIFFGDIAISLDKVSQESTKFDHCFGNYFCYILIHGVLHLVGYRHETFYETNVMNKLKNMLLLEIRDFHK